MKNTPTCALRKVALLLIAVLLLTGLMRSPSRVLALAPAAADLPVIRIDPTNITTINHWVAGNVYYVVTDIIIPEGMTLTIDAGAIVKFKVPYDPDTDLLTTMYVDGTLQLNGTQANPVYFTSGRDDSRGGNTNTDDQGATTPDEGDWDAIVLRNRTADVQYVVMEYSKYGLQVPTGATSRSFNFHDNTFNSNYCGLTLTTNSAKETPAYFTTTINNNSFTQNEFGFCTTAQTAYGEVIPTLRQNNFTNNKILPIYLRTGFPVYDNNTFVGYDPRGEGDVKRHLGIGLGGVYTGIGMWPHVSGSGIDMPYVAVTDLEIATGADITIPAGLVIKFFTRYEVGGGSTGTGTGLRVIGLLNLLSTQQQPIVFTSYHDDTVNGITIDTNGDGLDSKGAAGDWVGMYFPETSVTPPVFQYLQFKYAENGLFYDQTKDKTTLSPIVDSSLFEGNQNGLRLKAYPNSTLAKITPIIQNCIFVKNGLLFNVPANKDEKEPGVPILLENFVDPTYSGNTFTDNLHAAIGIAGKWRNSVTWQAVPGGGLPQLPYLVHGNVVFGDASQDFGIDNSVTLTLPPGTVIKFVVNKNNPNDFARMRSSLQAAGKVVFQSSLQTSPIVFTSMYDSAYGGNTNGNSQISDTTPPSRVDWIEFVIRQQDIRLENVIFRYGEKALHIENETDSIRQVDQVLTFTGVRFEGNEHGLYLDIQDDGNIGGLIHGSTFSGNAYGLTTFAKDTFSTARLDSRKVRGIANPTVHNCSFLNNFGYPVFLNGSANLSFQGNIFQSNGRRAIALGGYWGAALPMTLPAVAGDSNAPLGGKTFPYVVLDTTVFDWDTRSTVAGGLVFKVDVSKTRDIRFYGELTMETASNKRNIFTSLRDDVYDDTNGTPTPNPTAVRGDWRGVYVFNPAINTFSYVTVKYADQGLVIAQDAAYPGGNRSPLLIQNTYEENKNGLTLQIQSDYDLKPLIDQNTFLNNDYGMHTRLGTYSAVGPHCGTANPTMRSTSFNQNQNLPIYLEVSSNPIYESVTFTGNTHPGIGVGGWWCRDATWTRLKDSTGAWMPYVVVDDLIQEYYEEPPDYGPATIQLPAGLVIKFQDDMNIYAYSLFEFQSTPSSRIVITSYKDDTYGGDTDAATTLPLRNDYGGFWLVDRPGKNHQVHDIIARYGIAPISVWYDGPENTAVTTVIRDSDFNNNAAGILLAIGWRQLSNGDVLPGKGDVRATLSNITFTDNDYGLLTAAHKSSTGIVKPVLENLTFTNTLHYPLYFGGTTYPIFSGVNLLQGGPEFGGAVPELQSEELATEMLMELKGMELPGNAEAIASIQPGEETALPELQSHGLPGTLMLAGRDYAPAVALGGAWNNSGELMDLDGIPFVVVGNFPVTLVISTTGGVFKYTPSEDMVIGEAFPDGGAPLVRVPAGSIFKLNIHPTKADLRLNIIVKGGLMLQSTPSQPVTFTSFKDDSVGGDTNEDGSKTVAAPGDWGELRLSSSLSLFQDALVRYATGGVHVYFEGLSNQNITPQILRTRFVKNTTGLTLTAFKLGHIFANIEDNLFQENATHILGKPADVNNTGRLCVEAHNNDILGGVTQTGVINNNINTTYVPDKPDCEFNAINNFWGHASGPFHPGLNPAGKGTTVSDRVKFNPWKGAAVFPAVSYTVGGRIVKAGGTVGIAGVVVTLAPTTRTATTDQDGYFQFDSVPEGSYVVIPFQGGYQFTPTQRFISIYSDSLENDFTGTATTLNRTVNIDSMVTFRPISSTRVIKLRIWLNQPLTGSEKVTVNWTTLNGSAIAGTGKDYKAASGTVTLSSNSPETTISVTLYMTSLNDPEEFFLVQISNPTNAVIGKGAAVVQILPNTPLYLPMIRK